ncbi:hypothetical protein ColLi_09129 [Colletotrichum liriopes]|uniref:Uncharacterized protein n=1 Tax=Colletotrichum liriopes TaxID=708192 RepID=A0AA37LW14_9PEZI|nr:hypothetical protein ColLi_09129 [Colletotrichum liriopes]
MEQDLAPLLMTPEQWFLWPDTDAAFSNYLDPDELQGYALPGDAAISSGSYPLQQTPDFMLGGLLPSAPPGPEDSLGLGVGPCIGLTVADDMGILASNRTNSQSYLSRTEETAAPLSFPPFHNHAMPSTSPTVMLRQKTCRKRARRRVPQPNPSQTRLAVPKTPKAHKIQDIADTIAQSSKPPLPVDAVGGPSTARTRVDPQPCRQDDLSAEAKHPQQRLSMAPSAPAVAPRGRDNAARTSAKQQERKRRDRATRVGKTNVTGVSVVVGDYQQHVMNLLEFINRQAV